MVIISYSSRIPLVVFYGLGLYGITEYYTKLCLIKVGHETSCTNNSVSWEIIDLVVFFDCDLFFNIRRLHA